MPGPAPKPKDQRRHRNATPGFIQIDPSPRTGPTPPWPIIENAASQFRALELERWEELWRLPQAREWERMHCDKLVALYARLEVLVSSDPNPKLITEMRQLDAAIGVSPKAMQGLRWEIPQTSEGLAQGDARPELHSVDRRVYVPAATG